MHIGLYDRQYSEIEDGVTYTYVESIYRGETKQIRYDYGNTELNKTIKYFYDEKGNNTAIIEQYDRDDEYKNDLEYANTICITYTYNNNNDVTYICDQGTKYSMLYKDGEMSSLKIGNQELIAYDNSYIVENEDSNSLAIGSVIDRTEKITTYGPTRENDVITDNEGVVKTVTITYKVAEDDVTSTQTVQEIYYDNSDKISYKTEYTSEGEIKAFHDYTNVVEETDLPITYTYTYTDNGTTVSREGFVKNVITETSELTESEDGGEETTVSGEDNITKSSTTTTSYSFKDIKNNDVTYTSSITIAENEGNSYEEKIVLHNGDTSNFTYNESENIFASNIYSELYDVELLKTTQTEVSNTSTTFSIEKYAEDKNIEYTYDLAGNIVEIKVDGVVLYKYTYDAHGRLRTEIDYKKKRYHEYRYGDTGNMSKHRIFKINDDGSIAASPLKEMAMTYDTDGNWKDQLISYNGKPIEYNKAGNPIRYLDEMTFSWSRGRQLSGIIFDDGTETQTEEETVEYDVTYKYNQEGLRTYKETSDIVTTYEWDASTLVRETVKYKATNKIYDIWYFYDSNGDAIGFEYSFINDVNEKSTTRIYYEKDLQGNVIGLLDCRGAEIATYFYDAWGNITESMCYEGYEVPFALNHITYRGYYRDEETGFYYLQSRYYDAEICRFINADDVNVFGIHNISIFKDNIYIYCNGDPINSIDPSGYISFKWVKVWKVKVGFNILLSNTETNKLIAKLNVGAGMGALTVSLAAIPEVAISKSAATIAGVISAVLWIYSGVLSYANAKGKGIKICIRYKLKPPFFKCVGIYSR